MVRWWSFQVTGDAFCKLLAILEWEWVGPEAQVLFVFAFISLVSNIHCVSPYVVFSISYASDVHHTILSWFLAMHRLYDELTDVNDEIGDLEDRLAALKDKAESLGKKYITAKKESEKADKEVQVHFIKCTRYYCC